MVDTYGILFKVLYSENYSIKIHYIVSNIEQIIP